jgi:hypothetical protein
MANLTDRGLSGRPQESPLDIQTFIDSRLRELGLSRSELVRRCGYRNIAKGLRRLEEACAGNLEKTTWLLGGLPAALNLSPDIVQRALNDTHQQLDERASHSAAEADAAWRAAFKPHAYLLGTHTRPSQLLFFGITGGAERWLKIPLDVTQSPLSYAAQALGVVRKTPIIQFFGRTTGFIVNYSPDHAVRFDLEDKPMEMLPRAYRPVKATVRLGRRAVSAENFGRVVGTIPAK